MTIKEIKDLTRFLTDEEVDKIKNEIKSKEDVLKSQDMDEKEMTQVLNTLFAILVIEKTLETEIEDIEEIREELEKELMESYEIYDAHMAKYKSEEKKKKKKRWLLDFLLLSDRVHTKKEGIGTSNKMIASLQKELNNLKQQKSNENLRNALRDRDSDLYRDFCDIPGKCNDPRHDHYHDHDHDHRGRADLDVRREARRNDRFANIAREREFRESIDQGRNQEPRDRSGIPNKEDISRRINLVIENYELTRNIGESAVSVNRGETPYQGVNKETSSTKENNEKHQDSPTKKII